MTENKNLLKDVLIWYMLVSAIWTFIQMIYFYNEPIWGFSEHGWGVIATVIFPLIWLLIFAVCKHIETKHKTKNGEYTEQAKPEERK